MTVRRISIGPGEVAGYFSKLKAGFDELGVPCEHFVLAENKFGYAEDGYFLRGSYQWAMRLRESSSRISRLMGLLAELAVRAIILAYVIVRCDVFIFSGFGSFFRFRELWLLKLLGKKVLVVYLGSDARPPVFSGRHLDDSGGHVDPETMLSEMRHRANLVSRAERDADLIVNHTATAQFLTREFVRLNAVGMPIGAIGADAIPHLDDNQRAIRILHAPSRPQAKGSPFFRQVIDELRSEGYPIDFIELAGVPNSTVLQELQRCDFVLDELYSDVPLAMLGTEAALFGKPVVVGGYYAGQYRIDNPDSEWPPALYVEPENIKDAVRKLIEDSAYRVSLGKRANEFVRRRWDVRAVAENYLRLFSGDFPPEWRCSPDTLRYYWGWGLSKESWRRQVGEYVGAAGEEALLLDQHPRLKRMVLGEIRGSRELPQA